MEKVDEMLGRLEALQNDPAYQQRQQELREQRAKEVRAALGAAQREMLSKLGLAEKDLELIRADRLATTTLAVEALARAAIVTVLSGGPGTGKTTAAAWWLHAYVTDPECWNEVDSWGSPPKPKGIPVFVTAARLARWPRYNEAEMDRLIRAPRLVIDDLGAEFLDEKGSFRALIDEVVNERYANRRPTVITTNLDVEPFKDRYGERVADRIRESGKWMGLGKVSMRGGPAPAAAAPVAQRPPARPALPPRPAHDPRLPREDDPDDIGTGVA